MIAIPSGACAFVTLCPKRARRLAVIGIVMLSCLAMACTTTRSVVPPGTAQDIRVQVRVDDIVRMHLNDGTNHTLRVSEVKSDSLVGITTSSRFHEEDAAGPVSSSSLGAAEKLGVSVEVPYADITRLDAKRFSVIKTTVLVVAGVLVVVGAVYGAAGIAAANGASTL